MYLMRITPQGISYPRRSLRERVKEARVEFDKIALVVRSELRAKVFQKALGMVFLAIEPIMTAFVYYVLTFIILGSHVTSTQFMTIYISVTFWRWMSKTIDGSPNLFPTYASILKQTNFSVASLVFAYCGIEFVNFVISLVVLVIVCIAFGFYPNAAYPLLIFPMLAEAGITVLLTVVFSSCGVFIRDLQGFLSSVTGVWFYLSPGIYPIEKVPASLLWIYYLNPFAHILPAYQDIMMTGRISNIPILCVIFMVSTGMAAAALVFLQRIRLHFFPFI